MVYGSSRISESHLIRFALPVAAAGAAALIGLRLFSDDESPLYLFLAATILTALYAGLGPALLSIVTSLVLIRLIFISPYSAFTWPGEVYFEEFVHLTMFGLVSAMACSLLAGCRRDRDSHKATAQQYQMAAESAPLGLLIVDELGTIGFVNQRAEALFAATASEMIGKPVTAFFPDELNQIPITLWDWSLRARWDRIPVCVIARQSSGQKIAVELTLNVLSAGGKYRLGVWIRPRTTENGDHHQRISDAQPDISLAPV